MQLINLTGQKFGRLTVIKRSDRKGETKRVFWDCQCECGKAVKVVASDLRNGHTRSCGCLRDETSRHSVEQLNRIHGMTGSPEHTAYLGAIYRCTNSNGKDYALYGGRGIKFLFTSFEEFYKEVGPKPEPKNRYSLDRIDGNGHYAPGNVRWTTWEQQNDSSRKHPHNLIQSEVPLSQGGIRNKIHVTFFNLGY